MKVSLKWLKTMTEVPSDLHELTARLDLTGIAVEDVRLVGAGLEDIVVGQIMTREHHPDSDHLWVTTVDVGACNTDGEGHAACLQIVCGAQNFEAGDKVPVALCGATLPDGTKIKKAKMRGIESRGMNCSARELGLGEDHAGLLILAADAPIGVPIADYLGLADTIIDLEITPNRPDCMSMLGIAREVAAIQGGFYTVGRAVSEPPVGSEKVSDLVRVTIDDPGRCGRYTARVIKGVRIGPSPDWLAERVTAAGGRSINNIVDATNYIMYELGQPLHAFDLATLAKDAQGRAHVVVCAATNGEHFTTLDKVQRTLDEDITCIVDGNAANGAGATIALAGVMGGLDSEVTDQTTDILLESATFSSAHTSRTSRRLQLFSEASARYERTVDAATCDEFSARAAALIIEVAGGELCEGVVDVWPEPLVPPTLAFRIGRFQDFIGAPVPLAEIVAILTRLGCRMACHDKTITSEDGSTHVALGKTPCHIMEGSDCAAARAAVDECAVVLPVRPPSYRPDLTREIDLYEEVLRVWGMEKVPSTLPGGRGRIGTKTLEQQRAETVGRALRAVGLNETMTYAFASPTDEDIFQMPFDEHQLPVELINPMNSEQSRMRRSILPGLLRSVAYNLSRGVADVQLYETGVVFFASEGRKQPKEREMLAAVLVGSWTADGWNTRATPLDFFDGKGVLENLLRELNSSSYRFRAPEAEGMPWLQPGRAAQLTVGSRQIGWIGEVHPRVSAAFDIAVPLVAFELDLAALLAIAQPARPYKDVPQFPAVELDVALVVDEEVTVQRLTQAIGSAGGSLLDSYRLFDVFRDEKRLGTGKKSLAFALSYRAPDRTLTLEEVEKLHARIIGKVTAATGAQVRA